MTTDLIKNALVKNALVKSALIKSALIKTRIHKPALPNLCLGLSLTLALLPAIAQADLYITIVQGLGGDTEYEDQFDEQRNKIEAASQTLTAADKVSSFSGAGATRAALLEHFRQLNSRMTADDRAAIYLIGHGSYDGFDYKFNISGPDLAAADFKQILDALPGRNHLLLNTSSTSGALIETITGEPAPRDDAADQAATGAPGKYLLIAATRNGNERNATHFGHYFAEALTSEAADLNKNNNISVQEAFDYAAREVASYFEEGGKLATEHPQLRGEGAAQFSLSRLNELELEPASADPQLEALQQQRLTLETQIEELQLRRNEMTNAAYIEQLQTLILRSAELSERIEAERAGSSETATPASTNGSERF